MASMKSLQEENQKLIELVKRKELTCDLPSFALWMSLALMAGHCFLDLPYDLGMFYFGLYSCFFLFALAYVRSELDLYHQILGRKALEMGCPMVTRYENHQGTWGYYTYVLVNPLAFTRLLSCPSQESATPLSREEGKAKGFSRKFRIEKVSSLEDVGRSFTTEKQTTSEKGTEEIFPKKKGKLPFSNKIKSETEPLHSKIKKTTGI